jgi:tRNA G18 (ribose-2'-O)-methylase SpoU
VAFLVNIDASDERLRDYTDLTDVALRKIREPAEGLYIAESPKVIRRAVAAGHQPRSALVLPDRADDVLATLSDYECPIFVGEPRVLEEIAGFHLHRGALASFFRPELDSIEKVVAEASTIVICEDLVDHTNVGAIFRSVAALGADGVLISPRCADPLYRRSIRVSMGAVFNVPWTRMDSWVSTTRDLHREGFHIAALALNSEAVSLESFAQHRPDRVALILGTEGSGLSAAALSAADSLVQIPMHGGVDSLNVASASAVALYVLCATNAPSMSR